LQNIIIFLFGVSMVLIVLSKIMQSKIEYVKKTHGIQDGRIAYSDLNVPGKSFFSKRYRISGKPDYIVKRENRYIPVELKSGNYDSPQKNHVFQLAAYCQLVEENYGVFVPYGILVYSDGSKFNIPFDPRVRFELEKTVNDMRQIIKKGRITMIERNLSKCKSCSMREYCNIKT